MPHDTPNPTGGDAESPPPTRYARESDIDPDDQSWFWTPEWQAAEAEAERDIAEGRVTYLDTEEDIWRHFRSLQKE